MKIVNKCEFETKMIKDLLPGECFLYVGKPYMRICADWERPSGYTVIDLGMAVVEYLQDPYMQVEILDAELCIKPCGTLC